jgi:uncharacterized protein YndB with AHSA1/START domain
MSTETGTSLRLTRVVGTDPEAAFRAWTEAAQMKRWACPEGMRVEEAVSELVVGGAFRLAMVSPDGDRYTAEGEYREVDPPRRVAYTWDWKEEPGRMNVETLVTVEFNGVEGGTKVVLTHERFPTDGAREGHREGWESTLNQFEKLFE